MIVLYAFTSFAFRVYFLHFRTAVSTCCIKLVSIYQINTHIAQNVTEMRYTISSASSNSKFHEEYGYNSTLHADFNKLRIR